MARLRFDDVQATLATNISNITTTISFGVPLRHDNGTNVATLASGDYFTLSIVSEAGRLVEIVYVTAYTSGALFATVLRGQEGTTAVASLAGSLLVNAPTALDFSLSALSDVSGTPTSGQVLSWHGGSIRWVPTTVSSGGGGGGGGGGGTPVAFEEFTLSTIGASVLSLQNEPVDILMLSWVGITQPPSEYSWSGTEVTLNDAGLVTQPGDKVTVVYTYEME